MDKVSKLKNFWEKEYENVNTPFDVENPDEWVAELERCGKIRDNVLDSGCGPGRTSLYLAGKGYNVTGIDISGNAIDRAKQNADAKKYETRFIRADICELTGHENFFGTVIDIGCLHSIFDENARKKYAATLHRVCKAEAAVFLRAFSGKNLERDDFPVDRGLPALNEEQIRTAFENGWAIQKMEHREIDILGNHGEFKKGYCWFAEIKRK
jgi:cyclopropane fatty-acyl-phospholipid synthase-like methyltransferase